MKELSIAEKARYYDEALERAKSKIKNNKEHVLYEDDIIEIFPELKENEDEKIKKALISILKSDFEKDTTIHDISVGDIIAWLEKQSEQSSNILWHDVSEEPEVQREIFCEWKSSTGIWHSIVFYHADSKTFCEGERIVKNVLKWTYVNEMLEKQDIDSFTLNEENERIRKEIKQHFLHLDDSFPDKSKWLAWLEKYNKDSQVTLPPFTFDDILAVQCCMETVKKVQEDKDLYDKLNDLHSRLYDAYHSEKQGKQKSIWHNEDEEPQKDSFILIILQDGNPTVAKVLEPNHTINQGERWAYIDDLLEKQDRQKSQSKVASEATNEEMVDNPDKDESKFKVADWIVMSNGKVYQVKYVNKYFDEYILASCDCNRIRCSIQETDKSASAFTIEDAKDGDVLAWDNSKCIALFKNIYDKDTFNSHGFAGHCSGIFEARQGCHNIEGAHPATKEQHDILFQKMKEAGYRWNESTKELINNL